MFNSSILDVVIGLVFTFLGVSLATSAVTEAITSFLKLRQTTLLSGIKALVNDPDFTGLARDLYNHALVNPLAPGGAKTVAELKRKPAYIEAKSFAAAIVGILERGEVGKPLRDTVAAVPDPQLRTTLQVLLTDAGNDRAAFQAAIGAWFDAAMDRLGGWYKRDTQVISFVVAFLVCVILNADALHVGAALWQRPMLASELAAAHVDAAMPVDVLENLERSSLIGWDQRADISLNKPWGLASMLLGWLLVAGASLFGAPFWFDTLQRFIQIRGTGKDDVAGAPKDKA